jgi:hypothetical protein
MDRVLFERVIPTLAAAGAQLNSFLEEARELRDEN